MKIIFLDIDGVLNSRQEQLWHQRTVDYDYFENFCPLACSNLAYILESDPDVRIVVSSTWRFGRTLEELQRILSKNGIPAERVIDKTGTEGDCRGEQIDTWLKAHPEVSQFIIIDDDADMDPHMDRLVRTLPGNGFMFYDMLQAAKMLEVELKRSWL